MDEESLQRDIEAIEAEKKEFLEKGKVEGEDEIEEEVEEDVDVEETEFSLTASEIDEWINELTKLKEEKGSIELEVDEETNLKINYEEESGESEE